MMLWLRAVAIVRAFMMRTINSTVVWRFAGLALAITFAKYPIGAQTPSLPCTLQNGDVNADGTVNVSDALTLVGNIFLGAPDTLRPLCGTQGTNPPATGQLGDWPQCPGDDGFYRSGCPTEGRFVDNGDGTINDLCTGLMWLKRTIDYNNDSVRVTDADKVTWRTALQYCQDLLFAGHNDWRLPNARELGSLIDCGRNGPAVDPIFDIEGMTYWSSTPNMAEAPIYRVDFWSGGIGAADFDDGYMIAVREGVFKQCSGQNGDTNADSTVDISDAVTILGVLFLGVPSTLPRICAAPERAGLPDTGQKNCYTYIDQTLISVPCDTLAQDGSYSSGCTLEDRFQDNGDGTVTDLCTGLIWQQSTADVNNDGHSDDRDLLPQCEAIQFCQDLVFAGHDDWRLPTMRELESIIDYGRHDPAIDPIFDVVTFTLDKAQNYWSSTSGFLGIGRFCAFGKWGGSGGNHAPSMFWVRAVRGP